MLGPSAKTEWGTPRWLFDAIAERYGPFDLDVCALPENAKAEAYFTPEQNGLLPPWRGRVWMNPPYGRGIGAWVSKARQEAARGAHVVCLLPVRTSAKWWRLNVPAATVVEFLPFRVPFDGSETGAPFDSAIVVFFPAISKPSARTAAPQRAEGET